MCKTEEAERGTQCNIYYHAQNMPKHLLYCTTPQYSPSMKFFKNLSKESISTNDKVLMLSSVNEYFQPISLYHITFFSIIKPQYTQCYTVKCYIYKYHILFYCTNIHSSSILQACACNRRVQLNMINIMLIYCKH